MGGLRSTGRSEKLIGDPENDLHSGSDAKKAFFASEAEALQKIFVDHQRNWEAMAEAVPPQYCVSATVLTSRPPASARAFAYNVVEGTYVADG